MISWIVGSSVRFRLLVIGGAVAVLLVGATQLRNARVDVLPEFTQPYVEVQTEALGLAAEEVEELITVPLEADLLNGVPFLQEIRSESIAGLSSIVMTFEPATDIYRARQVVAERLSQAHALPNVSKPPEMLQPLSSENRVMMVSLRSSELPLIDMSVLARWTMRPRLMGVPGVANVSIWGERNRQVQVLVDPAELEAQGVSLGDVIRTTGNSLWVSSLTFLEASTPGTGGFIDTPNQRLGIQHIMPIRNAADLARVAVESEHGRSGHLRLGDVATVVEDHQPLIGDAVLDAGDGLLLVIEKFPGVNTLDVTRRIDAALEAMKPGLGGMEIDSTIFRPANFIEAALGNIGLSLLLGFMFVAFVLGAFLFDWRAAVVSLVTIPLSLAAAALVLHYAGASLNVMILAGLVVAIAVVVDDATTGVSAVLHRLRHSRPDDAERSVAQLVIEATVEGRGPIVYATVVILATLVPFFFIGGSASSFLPPMAVAYAVAVLASFGVSLTVAPAMAVLLLSRESGDGRLSPILGRLRTRYQTTLSAILNRARPSPLIAGVATVALATIVGLVLVLQTQASLVPAFRSREVLIQWDGAPGTSHPEQARIVALAGAELRALDGVANVGSHVGRAILSDQVASVSRGRDLGDNRSLRGLRPHDGLDPENGERLSGPEHGGRHVSGGSDRTDDGRWPAGRDSPGLRAKPADPRGTRRGHPSGDGRRGRRIGRDHRQPAPGSLTRGRRRPGSCGQPRREGRRRPSRCDDSPVWSGGRPAVRGAEGVRGRRMGQAGAPRQHLGRRGPPHRDAFG